MRRGVVVLGFASTTAAEPVLRALRATALRVDSAGTDGKFADDASVVTCVGSDALSAVLRQAGSQSTPLRAIIDGSTAEPTRLVTTVVATLVGLAWAGGPTTAGLGDALRGLLSLATPEPAAPPPSSGTSDNAKPVDLAVPQPTAEAAPIVEASNPGPVGRAVGHFTDPTTNQTVVVLAKEGEDDAAAIARVAAAHGVGASSITPGAPK